MDRVEQLKYNKQCGTTTCSETRAGTYRQAEFDGVDRLVERPGELMLPQSLHHHVLHVLQLVGLSDGHKHTTTTSQSCRRTASADAGLNSPPASTTAGASESHPLCSLFYSFTVQRASTFGWCCGSFGT